MLDRIDQKTERGFRNMLIYMGLIWKVATQANGERINYLEDGIEKTGVPYGREI